jgi:hypothetical protein
MARPSRALSWRLLVPAFGALAAVGVASQLTRLAGLVVHQCVPDAGLGWLGVRLALLRVDAVCPNGSLAVGGDQRQVLAVVFAVALPVLLGHLLLGCLGIGALAQLRRLAGVAIEILAGVRANLPDDVVVRVPSTVRVAIAGLYRPPVVREAPIVPWWRGPPAPQLV